MTKIHLLIKKEDICKEKMMNGNKIAVVLDVLLATTTITSALYDGAKEVIPVLDPLEAVKEANGYGVGDCILAGELNTKPIDGFFYPSPKILRKEVEGKSLILSTTNGTIALRKASVAKKVYIASLLNNPFIADRINMKNDQDLTIVVICSGNSGEMSLEDFYGAGHLITHLMLGSKSPLELTDAAQAAVFFYQGNQQDSLKILASSRVGKMFDQYNSLDELQFASRIGIYPIVPVLQGKKIVLERLEKRTEIH